MDVTRMAMGSLLVLGAAVGCGPSTAPVATSGGGGSTTAATTTGGASMSGGLDSTGSDTTVAASTGTTASDESSSSGDPLDRCPPRTLDGSGFTAWWTLVDGRFGYTGPLQADCVFDQIAPVSPEPGSTALELSCTLPEGQPIALTLLLRFELEPATVPFDPGTALQWETAAESCCESNDQTFMTLRTEDGTLQVAGFNGFSPEGLDGAQTLIEPISLALHTDVCPPCEGDDCFTRGALDVTVAGSETVRIHDGTVADVGTDPAFRAYVVTAGLGSGGFGAPSEVVTVALVRIVG